VLLERVTAGQREGEAVFLFFSFFFFFFFFFYYSEHETDTSPTIAAVEAASSPPRQLDGGWAARPTPDVKKTANDIIQRATRGRRLEACTADAAEAQSAAG